MLKRCLPKLLRLDRLGDGGESAKSAIATAKAVVAETGDEHVHKVTKRVASFKNNGNSNRDLFRFIRLPLDISWVTCPVFEKPGSDKVVDGLLPMYDPHELLQYLWTTGRMKATPATIETIGFQSLMAFCFPIFVLIFVGLRILPMKNQLCSNHMICTTKGILEALEQGSCMGCQPFWEAIKRDASFHLWR